MFQSTKRIGPISTGHRQWKADNHCRFVHGYGRIVELTFEGDLDERTWVYDFGNCKWIKNEIEKAWDHRTLIASNDPYLDDILDFESKDLIRVTIMDVDKGHSPGIEGSCKWVFDTFNPKVLEDTNGRVKIKQVRIWEHENNSAIYVNDE